MVREILVSPDLHEFQESVEHQIVEPQIPGRPEQRQNQKTDSRKGARVGHSHKLPFSPKEENDGGQGYGQQYVFYVASYLI